MHKTVWVVRRRESDDLPYRTVGEFADKETAVAEFRSLAYRDLACDPSVETREIEGRLPSCTWGTRWEFQYPYRSGAKTRLFESKRDF